jgi:delta(3,5)-delta(2,4)-dienoyl-CoA isomerase
MWLELRVVFDTLSKDPNVRVIVMSGAGDRAFSTGLDIAAASNDSVIGGSSSEDGARQAVKARRHVLEFQDCLTAIERCEKRRCVICKD